MSIYKGEWPEGAFIEANIKVSVDGQPLPVLGKEVPGSGQSFGWGNFSRWANEKTLAESILLYEIHNVMGVPDGKAQQHVIALMDKFLTEHVAKFDYKWSLTGEDIQHWIAKIAPEVWGRITSGK